MYVQQMGIPGWLMLNGTKQGFLLTSHGVTCLRRIPASHHRGVERESEGRHGGRGRAASSDRQRRAAQCRAACALCAVQNSPAPRAFGGKPRSAGAVDPPRTPGVRRRMEPPGAAEQPCRRRGVGSLWLLSPRMSGNSQSCHKSSSSSTVVSMAYCPLLGSCAGEGSRGDGGKRYTSPCP